MATENSIPDRLSLLTSRQRAILSLVCEKLTYEVVGQRMSFGVVLIKKEMAKVFTKLELPLENGDWRKRQDTLYDTVCPVLHSLVVLPSIGPGNGEIDNGGEPDPDPRAVAAVDQDQKRGSIPWTSHPGTTPGAGNPGTKPGGKILSPYLGSEPPPNKTSALPWMLVGILATLLAVAIGIIVFLLLSGRNTPTPASLAATAPAAAPLAASPLPITSTRTAGGVQPTSVPLQLTPTSTTVASTATQAPSPTPTATSVPTVDPRTVTFNVGERLQIDPDIYLMLTSGIDANAPCVSSGFGLIFHVNNESQQDYLVRFSPKDSFKVSDDLGNKYPVVFLNTPNFESCELTDSTNFTALKGQGFDIKVYVKGALSGKARQIFVTVDSFAGKGPFKFARQ